MILDDKSPADVHVMAYRSREQLRARLKQLARLHADRIKRLEGVMTHTGANFNDPALPGMKTFSLSPELERLILNPTEGL